MSQQVLQLIFLVWMFLALTLWFLMWREGTTRGARTLQALIDMGNKSAEAAQAAALAAQKLATLLERQGHA